jgi:hypothetical protein
MSQANQDKVSIALAEIVTASAGLHALLLMELDRRGMLPKAAFSDVLTRHADDLQANPPEGYDGHGRMDLAMIRGVVGFLNGPPPRGWTPTVIDGGKE